MSWTVEKDPCYCECPPPELTIEYKEITATSGLNGSTWRTATELVALGSFDDVAWGGSIGIRTDGTTDPDATPSFIGEAGVFYDPDPDHAAAHGSSVYAATRTMVRVKATYNGLDYVFRYRHMGRIDVVRTGGAHDLDRTLLDAYVSVTLTGTVGDEVVILEEELPTPAAPDLTGAALGYFPASATFLVGRPITPAAFLSGRSYRVLLQKEGFASYSQANALPKVYRIEDASGSGSGEQAVTYTFNGDETDTGSVVSYASTISLPAQVITTPRFPDFAEPDAISNTLSIVLSTETSTVRRITTPDGLLTLTLSDEITTSEIQDMVDTILANAFAADPEDVSSDFPLGAISFLSSGETRYERGKSVVVKFEASIGGGTVGVETFDVTVRWKRRLRDFSTGDTSTTDESATATFTKGSSSTVTIDLDDIDADASTEVLLVGAKCDPVGDDVGLYEFGLDIPAE